MSLRRRNCALVLVGVLACVLVITCLALSREDLWFWALRLHRKNPRYGQEYAQKLSSTKRGVDLALDDFGLLGGSTRGWSTWILQNSPHQQYVETRLKGILADERATLDKRLGALLLLWDRTRDPEYLEQCFVAVRNPGPPIISFGRDALASAVGYKQLSVQITAPRDRPVPIDLARFKELLSEAGVLDQRMQ